MKSFKDFANLITEVVQAIEHPTHLEITPDKYEKGDYKGTAIENRGNHAIYGDAGIGGLDQRIKKSLESGDNIIHKSAEKYSREYLGKHYDAKEDNTPSSLGKQYAIGKTYELAASHHPEYKKAVYEDYHENQPHVLNQLKAHDYDSLVKGTYKHVARDTNKQFESLPVKTQYHNGDMNYHNSGEMLRDLHGHHNLTVFRGGDKHEFLHHEDPETGLNENEKFRAVHDAYGHGIHGNQFGPKGEETAWNAHRKMFTPAAVPAMTAETRGQNSYVNYTNSNLDNMKQMEHHRKMKRDALNSGNTTAAAKHETAIKDAGSKWNYAKQASVVLPTAMNKPDYNGEVPKHIAPLLRDKEADKNPTYDVHKDHLNLVGLAKHHNTTSHNSLMNPGKFNDEQAHSDLKTMAAVHGFTDVSHNPFKE